MTCASVSVVSTGTDVMYDGVAALATPSTDASSSACGDDADDASKVNVDAAVLDVDAEVVVDDKTLVAEDNAGPRALRKMMDATSCPGSMVRAYKALTTYCELALL